MKYGECKTYGKKPMSLRLLQAVSRLVRRGWKEYSSITEPHEWNEAAYGG